MEERRILGVLIEKAKTTPDAYPMSVNALVTGANQKSNRDPLLNLSDLDVEDILVRCQKKNLAIKIIGGRVIRWRHSLYEAWHRQGRTGRAGRIAAARPADGGRIATRASRMEPIDDLDALRRLAAVGRAKSCRLPDAGRRRGAVLTHGFHDPEELKRLHGRHMAEPMPAPHHAGPFTARGPDEIAALKAGRRRFARRSGRPAQRMHQFKQSLGMSIRAQNRGKRASLYSQ